MKETSVVAQQDRYKAGRALLNGADHGTLQVDGRIVNVRLSRSVTLVGIGVNKGLKLNPDSCITE